MVSKKSRSEIRVKKHNRLRNHLSGTTECPRLAVFRSNNHMYAQIIDDTVGKTLVAASTVEADVKKEKKLITLMPQHMLVKLLQKEQLKKVLRKLYLIEAASFTREKFRH